MINQLQLYGLKEQEKQQYAYILENSTVDDNWEALLQMLEKDEKTKLRALVEAKDSIIYYASKDCYINGFCAALKFMLDNIYDEIRE